MTWQISECCQSIQSVLSNRVRMFSECSLESVSRNLFGLLLISVCGIDTLELFELNELIDHRCHRLLYQLCIFVID